MASERYSKFRKGTKKYPSLKVDYLKQIQEAKAEFYIKSENTSFETIKKKYDMMVKTASNDYKKPRLELAYKLLKEYYKGKTRISKEQREKLIGHPVQKKTHQERRKKQMVGLQNLAKQAKQTRLRNAKIYQNPSGKPYSVVERKVPYEPRFAPFNKAKNKAMRKKEANEPYRKMKKARDTKARKDRGMKEGASRKDRIKKYTQKGRNPAGQKWHRPVKPTSQKIRKKYKTMGK